MYKELLVTVGSAYVSLSTSKQLSSNSKRIAKRRQFLITFRDILMFRRIQNFYTLDRIFYFYI
jgi:hypothetical protein